MPIIQQNLKTCQGIALIKFTLKLKAIPYNSDMANNTGMTTRAGVEALGALIKSARREKKLTLKELSAISGLTTGYIGNVENGYINPKRGPVVPSDESLRSLSLALDIPTVEMHAALGRGPELEAELDPDLQMIVENWDGMTPTGKRHMKSAAELALEMSRESSIGKRAE